ncbi:MULTISPECIES: transposase [unclassified Thermoactinomyces]|uniref:transposase n=1 Tax=unclassified Thermoactinomyces TaxID=2634588 RepID=UPI0018DBE4F9|nr:transposase [Thermoactinomyces sp. CICC 10523]MBH8605359.1 transposase [Thermoactinomyces sp. CICC 10522]MBH8609017.1 transposase [Thermoactinomyces sp. CICC 10521]
MDWLVFVDSTIVRAHQQPQARQKKGDPRFQNEALGRSREDLTTKIHLACDGKGCPLAFTLTPGQQHDCTQLQALLDSICVPSFGKGRPRKRPDHLIADRGYSYPSCRLLLLKRGIPHQSRNVGIRLNAGPKKSKRD